MKKYFITYSDENFKKSSNRIKKEAKKLNIFDEIIIYSKTDLPLYILSSPLFAFQRLGGYALWKSYIIYHTFQKCKYGDIIVYADSGCSLQNTTEWNQYFNLLIPDSTILFKYREDYDYEWKNSFGSNAIVKSKNWIKKSLENYFQFMFKNDEWKNESKIWSGSILICKGKNENILISEWFKISIFFPELIMDVFGNEILQQDEDFVENRHDQALLGILASYYKNYQKIFFVLETSESNLSNSAILATRLRDLPKIKLNIKIKSYIKRLIGNKNWYFFTMIKKIVRK